MNRQQAIVAALIAALFLSALSVVVAQHERRAVFVELQDAQQRADELREEWRLLQLELSALAGHSRIERIARSELGMKSPEPEDVVVIQRRQ